MCEELETLVGADTFLFHKKLMVFDFEEPLHFIIYSAAQCFAASYFVWTHWKLIVGFIERGEGSQLLVFRRAYTTNRALR